jgi:hypothetical protein
MDKAILDTYGARIGPYGVAVYALLARYADNNGHAFPSLQGMVKALGMSRFTVVRTLRKLEEVGLISKGHRKREKGGHANNIYTLLYVSDGASEEIKAAHLDTCSQHLSIPMPDNKMQNGTCCSELKQDLQEEQELPEEEKASPSCPPALEDTASPALFEIPKKPRRKKAPTADFTPEEFVAFFNAGIPYGVPVVQSLSPQRRKLIIKALQHCPRRAFWEGVIDQYHHSEFLCGMKPKREGHEHYKADLDWLLGRHKGTGVENYIRVSEGFYAD